MKIEKINDNKIRCTLTSADLAERNLKLSELAYGTEKARSLFQDMMLEANQQFGFNVDNAPLMVEAVPVAPDSIVLIITRVEDPQELDTRFAKFAPSGDDTDGPEPVQYSGADDIIDLFHKLCDVKNKAQEIAKKAAQKENEKEPAASEEKNVDLVRTFHFSTLDDVISSAKALNQYFTGSNSLYKNRADANYQLVLHQSGCKPEEFKKEVREGLPFLYVPYKLLFCDSLGWTYACACSALNAYIRVDFVMGISLSDSLYWTFSSAGSAAYTFVCDYICHDLILLVDFLALSVLSTL